MSSGNGYYGLIVLAFRAGLAAVSLSASLVHLKEPLESLITPVTGSKSGTILPFGHGELDESTRNFGGCNVYRSLIRPHWYFLAPGAAVQEAIDRSPQKLLLRKILVKSSALKPPICLRVA